MVLILLFSLNIFDKKEDAYASNRHQIVPVVKNVTPNIRKGTGVLFMLGLINCGRKDRKNSATFGLNKFVRKPCL
jgi:hypothetical protein